MLRIVRSFLVVCALFVCLVSIGNAQSTVLTYQGQLLNAGSPASGNFDFEFALFDSGGSQIGPVLTRTAVSVANGVFSVDLDFGSGFPGASRFLEIRVRQGSAGGFTTLVPRQTISSAPYSIKSLTADSAATAVDATNASNAVNATNAVTAANFSGSLSGDVTGTQAATTVARLQGRSVANTQPTSGQVLKFNGTQWVPDTDNVGGAGGGGTITGVTAGTGLTGGGTTGSVTVSIANGGVNTTQLADNSVTDAKIASVAGTKVTGTVANATNASTATTAINATQLSGVAANQYLQTNGNGSGLTNLNATSITTGTLANARLGQIPTANIVDNAVTAPKIATGQVVKGVTVGGTTLTDNITLVGGANTTVTSLANTVTIASTGGGVSGGVTNTVPIWSSPTTLGYSLITQDNGVVRLPNSVSFTAGVQGNQLAAGSPNGETGISFAGSAGRADIRFGPRNDDTSITALKLVVGPGQGPPSEINGVAVDTSGRVKIGTNFVTDDAASAKLQVNALSEAVAVAGETGTASGYGVNGFATGTNGRGVRGHASGGSGRGVEGIAGNGIGVSGEGRVGVDGTGSGDFGVGVFGRASGASGTALYGQGGGPGSLALDTRGTSWFRGDTTPLSPLYGSGVAIGYGLGATGGYVSAYDYTANVPKDLWLNNTGGNVAIGGINPLRTLHVKGRVRIDSAPTEPGTLYPTCFNSQGDVVLCGSSSLRWKTNVQPFRGGLDIIRALRPISFDWKNGSGHDIGLGAEEVAKIAPSMARVDGEGVVEGVRYERLNLLLINAIKEQQEQIDAQGRKNETQQKQIELLTKAVCSIDPKAELCPKN